jgi:[ribosomal protein S5]-alanine N-acetyltransferase
MTDVRRLTDVRLTTPRLILRELHETDLAGVHEYASDPEVARFVPWGPNTERDSRAFLRQVAAWRAESPRRQYVLAIEVAADGQVAGSCALRISEPEHRGANIGYALARRHWGRGYASEALQALIEFGFGSLGLHRIWAVCDPANTASARVLEKAGMRREGELLEHRWEKGRWSDELLYAILEREWAARSPRSRGDTMSVP